MKANKNFSEKMNTGADAYIVPVVRVVEVRVEKGYAVSDPGGQTDPWQ